MHGDRVLSLSGKKSVTYKYGLKKYAAEAQKVSELIAALYDGVKIKTTKKSSRKGTYAVAAIAGLYDSDEWIME